MKLHLHLLKTDTKDPKNRPPVRVAMTEFWPKDGAPVARVTFGSDVETDKIQESHRLSHSSNGLRGLAVLLMRSLGHEKALFTLEGELAVALDEIRRETCARGNSQKRTWLQAIFASSVGKPISATLITSTSGNQPRAALGDDLLSADFKVYIHESPSSVKQTCSGNIKGATVHVDEYMTYADQLEGEVNVSMGIEVCKGGYGPWLNPEQAGSPSILPLTSADRFRLIFHAKPNAHFYVVWIDSEARVVPVFPWLPGKGWNEPNASRRDTPRQLLRLTDEVERLLPPIQNQFCSIGKGGAETFAILAHRDGLELASVSGVFQNLTSVISKGERFASGIPYRFGDRIERLDIDRRPDLALKAFGLAASPTDDPLAILQAQLAAQLWFRVDVAAALVIPSLGSHAK